MHHGAPPQGFNTRLLMGRSHTENTPTNMKPVMGMPMNTHCITNVNQPAQEEKKGHVKPPTGSCLTMVSCYVLLLMASLFYLLSLW